MRGGALNSDGSRVDLVVEPDGLRVCPVGEIDYAARPQLDNAYRQVTERATRDIVIDLSATSFLDSFGMGFLLRLQQWATATGHRMTIVAVPQRVRRALAMTGLDRVLTVVPGPA